MQFLSNKLTLANVPRGFFYVLFWPLYVHKSNIFVFFYCISKKHFYICGVLIEQRFFFIVCGRPQ